MIALENRERSTFVCFRFELTALSKTVINVDHSSSPTDHLISVELTPPPPVLTVSVT